MNKLIAPFLALLLSVHIAAQKNTKEDYQLKAKKQKTIGWVLLGSGVATSFIGLSQLNFAGSDDGDVNNTAGAILFFTGLAATITSIPVFSSSKRSRKKAMSLSFKNEMTPQIKNCSMAYKTIPAVSFKISL